MLQHGVCLDSPLGSSMSFAQACCVCLCFSVLLFYATTPEPGAHKTLFSVSSVPKGNAFFRSSVFFSGTRKCGFTVGFSMKTVNWRGGVTAG